MGYPMTFGRLLGRNGLKTGGYGTRMSTVNLDGDSGLFARYWREALIHSDSKWGLLLGDLRRLEADAVDERAICKHVSQSTGIDEDTVAIVIKEFMSW